jgi:hypothetical protein
MLTGRERVEAVRTIALDEIDRRRPALFTNGASGIDNPVRLRRMSRPDCRLTAYLFGRWATSANRTTGAVALGGAEKGLAVVAMTSETLAAGLAAWPDAAIAPGQLAGCRCRMRRPPSDRRLG